jgi:hypothetical protein
VNTLPFDYSRCSPTEVCDKCRNCRRWFDHPEQRNCQYRQSFVVTKNSKDPACHYMPVSLLEEVK